MQSSAVYAAAGNDAGQWKAQPATSRRGAKSIRETSHEGSVQAAVRRLMQGSRPSAGDAAERLREVKRRVTERVWAATHGACEEAEDMGGGCADNGPSIVRCGTDEWQDRPGGEAGAQGGEMDAQRLPDAKRTVPAEAAEERHVQRSVRPRVMARGGLAIGAAGSSADCVQADDAHRCVGVACEWPGGPSIPRATDTVAEEEAVAALEMRRTAWDAQADHGEATDGPPRGHAAPRDDTKDTACVPLGAESEPTLRRMPPVECGGGPPFRQSSTPPQELPQRLGAGPSIAGRAEEP